MCDDTNGVNGGKEFAQLTMSYHPGITMPIFYRKEVIELVTNLKE